MKRALFVGLLAGLLSSSAMAYGGMHLEDPAPSRGLSPVEYGRGDSVRAARAEVERARWRLREDLRDHAPGHVIERDQHRLRRAEERLRWAEDRRHDRRERSYRRY